MIKCPSEYQSPSYIFSFLRKNVSEELSDAVKGLRKIGKKSAAFDVPEQYRAHMEKLIDYSKAENSYIKDF